MKFWTKFFKQFVRVETDAEIDKIQKFEIQITRTIFQCED